MVTRVERHGADRSAADRSAADRTAITRLLVGCVLGLAVLSTADANAAITARTLSATHAIGDQTAIAVLHHVGTVRFAPRAESGGQVAIEAEVRCSRFNRRCQRWADELELTLRPRGDKLVLNFENDHGRVLGGSIQIDLLVRVPAALRLEVDLGVGRVVVDDGVGAGGVDIDLGVGDVELRLPEEGMASVRLEVGVGTARIEPRTGAPVRSGFPIGGNDVRWRGATDGAKVRVDIGVGSARVHLE